MTISTLLPLLLLQAAMAQEAPPIINGTSATEDDWPSAGALLFGANVRGYGDIRMLLCSSTLIAPDVVLVAAHCVDDEMLSYSLGSYTDLEFWWTRQADLGDFDGYSTPDWPADAVQATQWVAKDEFDIRSFSMGIAVNNDVGLVFLSEPVTDVQYSYLVTAEEATQLSEGDAVTIVGWGQQTDDYMPPAGTYGYKMMGASTIGEIGEAEFQVGPNIDDPRKCHGDSGGPTFMDMETTSPVIERLIGVTSHSYDNTDCRRTGGVDTRVNYYLDWIDEQMRSRCEDGTRAWCDVEGIIPPPGGGEDTSVPDDTGTPADDTGTPTDDSGTPTDDSAAPTDDTAPVADDTGATGDDTGADVPDDKTCGCATAPSPLRWTALLALAGLVAGRRRR